MASTATSTFRGRTSSLGSTTSQNELSRGLPSSWYRSPELYQLERRAIFSKRWLLITHRLRLNNPDEAIRFHEAGFSFWLCVDSHGTVSGFHNICRFCRFPVAFGYEGNVHTFSSCRCRGLSYGPGGISTEVRSDMTLEVRGESLNLWPVHIYIDSLGFIWVNLDASSTPTVSWDDDFNGVDRQERFQEFDFTKYRFDHIWSMEGSYNWKTLADNYNECYHCAVAHPDVASLVDLSHYYTVSFASHIQHFARPREDKVDDDIGNASTYYFPNACMTVSPHFFYLMRCVPTSVGTCSMEYEVYRHKQASDMNFERVDSFFKRVLKEDKYLCDNTQKNLNAGVFVNGELHPNMECAPLYFQSLVRELVKRHYAEEKKRGQEIWPALQQV